MMHVKLIKFCLINLFLIFILNILSVVECKVLTNGVNSLVKLDQQIDNEDDDDDDDLTPVQESVLYDYLEYIVLVTIVIIAVIIFLFFKYLTELTILVRRLFCKEIDLNSITVRDGSIIRNW